MVSLSNIYILYVCKTLLLVRRLIIFCVKNRVVYMLLSIIGIIQSFRGFWDLPPRW